MKRSKRVQKKYLLRRIGMNDLEWRGPNGYKTNPMIERKLGEVNKVRKKRECRKESKPKEQSTKDGPLRRFWKLFSLHGPTKQKLVSPPKIGEPTKKMATPGMRLITIMAGPLYRMCCPLHVPVLQARPKCNPTRTKPSPLKLYAQLLDLPETNQ